MLKISIHGDKFFFVPIDIVCMCLFLWCFFIAKNRQKWVYMGMGRQGGGGEGGGWDLKSCLKAQQNTILLFLTNLFIRKVLRTNQLGTSIRGGSETAATSKMQHFVIIVSGWQLFTISTKRSILDVAAVLDPPLSILFWLRKWPQMFQDSRFCLHS